MLNSRLVPLCDCFTVVTLLQNVSVMCCVFSQYSSLCPIVVIYGMFGFQNSLHKEIRTQLSRSCCSVNYRTYLFETSAAAKQNKHNHLVNPFDIILMHLLSAQCTYNCMDSHSIHSCGIVPVTSYLVRSMLRTASSPNNTHDSFYCLMVTVSCIIVTFHWVLCRAVMCWAE